MAHSRSTLFLFACMACLVVAASPGRGASHLGSVSELTSPAASTGNTASLTPNPSRQATAQLPEHSTVLVAQANTPKAKPSPKTSQPPQKSNSKTSKLPQPVNAILQLLKRQRGLLILSLAALLVTAAAVFILLKLVSEGEIETASNSNSERRRPIRRPSVKNTFPRAGDGAGIVDPTAANSTLPLPMSSYPKVDVFGEKTGDPPAGDSPNLGDGNPYSNSNTDPALTLSPDPSPSLHQSTESPANGTGNLSLPEITPPPARDLVEQLIADLQNFNPAKRQKAIWELGQRGDSRAVRPLVNLLANSDSKQHSLILASLSEIGVRTLKPMNAAWLASLQSESAEVRKNAIRDLTRISEAVLQISYLLYRATDDPDTEVQETARWALTQLNRIRPLSGREKPHNHSDEP